MECGMRKLMINNRYKQGLIIIWSALVSLKRDKVFSLDFEKAFYVQLD